MLWISGKSTSRTESLTDLWQSSRAHLSSQAHAGTDMWKRKLQSTGEQRVSSTMYLHCTQAIYNIFSPLSLTCLRLTRQNGTMAEIGWEGLWAKQPWQLGPSRGPVESVYWQCTSRTWKQSSAGWGCSSFIIIVAQLLRNLPSWCILQTCCHSKTCCRSGECAIVAADAIALQAAATPVPRRLSTSSGMFINLKCSANPWLQCGYVRLV